MANLNTTFAGLKLRNPFIISSSGITSSVDRIRKLDSLGAGAVVLKSLFEEQIRFETGDLLQKTDYPEALDYVRRYTRENTLQEYLQLVREAKKAVHMPVIASINCISASEWMDFAVKIEEAGADALELNVYFLPVDREQDASHYERIYFDLLAGLKKRLSIPVIIKLGSNFTNLNYLISQLYYREANGVVLFNRFYAPDIDIEDLSMGSSEVLSSPSDIRNSLRWVGIVSGQVRSIDIAGSTGVHSGEAAVKMLLAGARSVQVCSVLYKNGLEYLTEMIDRLESWMISKNYKTIDEFRGAMSYASIDDPAVYERAQFMKYFSKLT
ncbi:MAG TPA: dihydroorotate dehydrogenase-like protein [Bacteroidales bacterium]|nr:dihydroorotate dehydrogenase-like protein [Bacteroidales bacterium]